MKTKAVAWWSGGVTSAIACRWAVDTFKNVEVVFIDTHNEDDDTYRFLDDCERWYGQPILRLSRIGKDYPSIQAIWDKYLSLNTAQGAICSTVLKREVREAYQDLKTDYAQVFGFDANEPKRHQNMRRNYPEINVISPLVEQRKSKADCIRQLVRAGISIPRAYQMGFRNNNCLKTGCVRGGIGYWQKMKETLPDVFNRMALKEHELTNMKGEPVTICKDQSKGGGLVFLDPHPAYPNVKDISMMKGRQPEPLIECNGFCSTED